VALKLGVVGILLVLIVGQSALPPVAIALALAVALGVLVYADRAVLDPYRSP
jgi:hypothetical protein